MEHPIIAIDGGYGYTKFFNGNISDSFPSVLGYPDTIHYRGDMLDGSPAPDDGLHLTTGGASYYVGQMALNQSSVHWSPQDRDRVHTTRVLTIAALAQHNIAGTINLVTGLPVNWYEADKDELRAHLQGSHTYRVGDAPEKTVVINEVIVMPQPFGSFFTKTINTDGRITNAELVRERTGVLDIGMHTTDFSVSEAFRFIQPESGSIQVGLSQIYSLTAQSIEEKYGFEIDLHRVDRAIRRGAITIYGERQSIADLVEPVVQAVANKILARAGFLWKDNGRGLARIFVTGGGASLVGPYLLGRFPHAEILVNSASANVRGFYLYGISKWRTAPVAQRNGRG